MTFRVSIAFTFLFALAAELGAESDSPPAWMKEVTRLPPGDHANLRPVKLAYSLAWNNRVNAGQFNISIERTDGGRSRFVGDAYGKSTGFARLLWPYDFQARSIVDEDSLRPINFQLAEKERNETSSYDIIFEETRQIYTTTSKKANEEARTATTRFTFDFGQDVLSSAFYLRSQELKQGEEVTMLVTPFNRPYVAKLVVTGREIRKIKGRKYNAIKLDAKIGKVNEDLTLKHYDKVKKTTLWVSNDEYRIPLELQAQISVGFVSARLSDLEWLE
ncbi:MAG: DUF3108 domain-containing protein [Verrucomicrobiota bacterium]